MLRIYRWLLWMYPASHRHEFGEEMTLVFCQARSELAPGLDARIDFYGREFCGLLAAALRAHWNGLFGPAIPFPRFYMQSQFRFPRATVFLMMVILAGVLLAISSAASIAGGSVWRTLVSMLAFMAASMCMAAGVVWAILHTLRRSGVHRLENVQGGMDPAEWNRRR